MIKRNSYSLFKLKSLVFDSWIWFQLVCAALPSVSVCFIVMAVIKAYIMIDRVQCMCTAMFFFLYIK